MHETLNSPENETGEILEPTKDMNFSLALAWLKQGARLQRVGWNGKRMFIFLVKGSTFKVNRAPLNEFYPEGHEINYHPHVDMRTADGTIVPWSCSQTDMLANDWQVVVEDEDFGYNDMVHS